MDSTLLQLAAVTVGLALVYLHPGIYGSGVVVETHGVQGLCSCLLEP